MLMGEHIFSFETFNMVYSIKSSIMENKFGISYQQQDIFILT